MDNRSDIRDFLATRRARLTPEQVGLPSGGGRRRVPGLRREEVAVLAGVSTEWYTRLEKGHAGGVSEDVLDAVARALQLDEAERVYLFDLARATKPSRTATQRRTKAQVRPELHWMLDSMTGSAAFVRNGRMDILAINPLGRALCAPMYDSETTGERGQVNIARFQFLDPRAHDYYPDWDGAANITAALLRSEAGRHPYDKALRELVGELSTVSADFRSRWAAHDVRIHRSGVKSFLHPDVGLVEITYHSMQLSPSENEVLDMTIYTAEPGSDSEDRLRLLASWAATHPQVTHTPVEEAK
ncbi:Helix-turn-helix domain-containing protein [Actinopolymorpha cephalotaxi]|uniref:Helix-turn-helix domain-containing protein n=1 Tax=Actinopolymorpha cephalotaxi TaxID=504797 RepID=A0A1I2XA78_9ACTN|nr:helix-turn-helix transcriptional regulator [Actinopolymorpha cephalotaxi]NYH86141.1 transcriptional regulator with XRE-family HTH domain [Actinopolymorpha cephalotaxi]SFH10408.1 Helix-turn-helix domain-containing protein [Actinopolymorpha cephalotaxi]